MLHAKIISANQTLNHRYSNLKAKLYNLKCLSFRMRHVLVRCGLIMTYDEVENSWNIINIDKGLSCVWLKTLIYRVILKCLRDFRPLRYSSRDGHAEGEHVNRGRGNPSFCPTLQVFDNVHPWWRGRCQSCNQVSATHVQRVWQEHL